MHDKAGKENRRAGPCTSLLAHGFVARKRQTIALALACRVHLSVPVLLHSGRAACSKMCFSESHRMAVMCSYQGVFPTNSVWDIHCKHGDVRVGYAASADDVLQPEA